MIEVRRGIPRDGALIARTRQKCWDATYRGIFPDDAIDQFDFDWHTARDETRLRKADFSYYLVMDGDSCVGYLSFGLIPEGSYRDFRFRLQSLYLLPNYQGMGLGRKLMEIAFDACRELGFDKLCWDCSPHNTRSIDFYTHIGGKIIDADVGHDNAMEDGCTFEYHITKGE